MCFIILFFPLAITQFSVVSRVRPCLIVIDQQVVNLHYYYSQESVGTEIVISGEWCNEVIKDFLGEEYVFLGRGIQYFLGFHHIDDKCR